MIWLSRSKLKSWRMFNLWRTLLSIMDRKIPTSHQLFSLPIIQLVPQFSIWMSTYVEVTSYHSSIHNMFWSDKNSMKSPEEKDSRCRYETSATSTTWSWKSIIQTTKRQCKQSSFMSNPKRQMTLKSLKVSLLFVLITRQRYIKRRTLSRLRLISRIRTCRQRWIRLVKHWAGSQFWTINFIGRLRMRKITRSIWNSSISSLLRTKMPQLKSSKT